MELVVLGSFLLVVLGSLTALALNSRDEEIKEDGIVRGLAIAIVVVILFEVAAWFGRSLTANAIEVGIVNLSEWMVAIPILLLFGLGSGRKTY